MKTQNIRFLNPEIDNEIWRRARNFLKGKTKGGAELYKKTAILLISYLAYYVIPFFVTVPPWLLIFAYSLLAGLTMASTGMNVMHDANHGSFASKQRVNKIFGAVMYLIGGYLPNWKMQHNVIHHSFTNVHEHDDDLGTGKFFRFSPKQAWKWNHRFQHLYAPFLYSLMTILWITSKDFTQVRRYKKEGRKGFENFPKNWIMVLISKVLYYAFWLVLPLLFWKAENWVVFASFIGMHLVAGFTLAIVFQLAHVTSLVDFPSELFESGTEHQLRTSCNFATKSKFITGFTGGLNHQIEHHLFPKYSHVHYHKLAPMVKEFAKEQGFVYNDLGSWSDALRNHFKFVKKLGDPNFVL